MTFYDNGFSWGPNPPIVLGQKLGPLAAGDYHVSTIAIGVDGVARPGATVSFRVAASGADLNKPSPYAIEYYNQTLDHYFVTASRREMQDLDSGETKGWERTGYSFKVRHDTFGMPVCRFYIPPELGDSHFYSASADECKAVELRFPALVLESVDVFRVDLPYLADGTCVVGYAPIYRLWNTRQDSNHRYVTDPYVRDQMLKSGYVLEGLVMCVWP